MKWLLLVLWYHDAPLVHEHTFATRAECEQVAAYIVGEYPRPEGFNPGLAQIHRPRATCFEVQQ